jgi:hypothetical protein
VAKRSPRRRGLDPLVLIAAAATLIAAAYVLTDGAALTGHTARWVLAGGAVLVGVLMLGGSRRDSRRGRDS